MKIQVRSALLASAMGGIVGAIGLASPSYAACTIVTVSNPNDTLNCTGTTTTTDFTRAYYYDTSTPQTINVGSGAIVNGFGLSFVDTSSFTGTLSINNGGLIQVNAGNTPTSGGNDAALNVTSNNSLVAYNGNGDIQNLGTGEAFGLRISGSGSFNSSFGGSLRADNGDAIRIDATGPTAGLIQFNTTAGETLTASNGNGITVTTNGTGDVFILSDAAIVEGAGGNLFNGIYVNSGGTGDVNIFSFNTIGASAARADSGIVAGIGNAGSDGDIVINAAGAIFADLSGVEASTIGTGDVSVYVNAAIDSGGLGVTIDTTSGTAIASVVSSITSAGDALTVTTTGGASNVSGAGNITSNGGTALNVTTGGGAQAYTLTGNILASGVAVDLDSGGGAISGSFGGIRSVANAGLVVDSGGGDVDLTVNGAVQADADAIAITSGDGAIALTANGAVTSTNGLGIDLNGGANGVDLITTGIVTAAQTGIDITTTSGGVSASVNGDVTSTAAGGILATTQTGAMNVTVGGDVTALGAASQGIFLQSLGTNASDLMLTTLAGSTIQARNVGVHVEQYSTASSGDVTVVNAATIVAPAAGTLSGGILATNQGTGSVDVTNSGNIGTSAARLTGNGIWGYVYHAGSAATLDIVNSGAVYANTAIAGTNLGSGATTITTGAATVNGTATGIVFDGATGSLDLTTGSGLVTGGTNGIRATSSGTQNIDINGAVTGTGAGSVGLVSSSSAARTIDIASGASISGVASAIDLAGAGTTAITNSGALSGPFLVRNTGTGAVSLTNNAGATMSGAVSLSTGADIIDNSGAYTFTGATTLGGGNDQVVNHGGATLTVSGSVDFGAGTDTLSNLAGGTLTTTTGSSIANLESLSNAGTMTVAGTLAFTGIAPAVTNSASLNLNGATVTGLGAFTNQAGATIASTGTSSLSSTGTFTNAGTIAPSGPLTITVAGAFNNGGTIDGAAAAVKVTATSFANTGTIDLQDGAIGDTFTVTGAYSGGAGARLLVDSSDTAADLLVVTGAISGTTAVDANLIGTGALAIGGVQVVDGRSTSTDNAFVLGTLTGSAGPLATYIIAQEGADYYLRAGLTDAGLQPLAAAAAVPDLWHPSADEVFANLTVPDKGGPGLGGWVQAYASHDKRGEREMEQSVAGIDYAFDTRVKTTRFGMQGGVDANIGGAALVGLTGGVARHNGNGAFDVDASGWNLGLYAGFGGETGAHGEILAKHDRNRIEFQDGEFEGDRLTAKSNGLEGQLGYRMAMGGRGANLDLTAGLSHVWNKLEGIEAFNLGYRYDDLDSIRGRLGARYNVGGAMQPYVSATVLREFARNGSLFIDDGVGEVRFETSKRGTWGRFEGGIGGTPNRFPMIAAWADFGKVKGLGARLGFRFGSAAETLPPPPVLAPPVAVEPAPVTQTCADGTIIQATDICPLPATPAPPAVTPERG